MDWKIELANKINNEWEENINYVASIIAVDYIRKLGITEMDELLPMLDKQLVKLMEENNPAIINRE